MPRVGARVSVEAPVAAAEALWYDLARRPSFVDGFAHVARVDDGWPAEGRLVWDSRPGGRGRVAERVVRHAAGDGQEAEVEDERIAGIQRVRFAPGTVALELAYAPKQGGVAWDLLVGRRRLRGSLERTLRRFAIELAADRDLGAQLGAG